MNISRRQPESSSNRVLVNATRQDSRSESLDEALEESFPASDPVAISITAIDAGTKRSKDQSTAS